MAHNHLNRISFTFVAHFLVIMDVKSHIIVFELRETLLQVTDILNFNYWWKDSKSIVFILWLIKEVNAW